MHIPKGAFFMLEGILLIAALCTDAFVASIAYGMDKIKIPLRSAAVIALIGTGLLACALTASAFIQQAVPHQTCVAVSFILLLVIGVYNLFQNGIKAYLRTKADYTKRLKFKFADIGFFISICLDETEADKDHSKVLSVREALYLALALSIDSLVTGIASNLATRLIFPILAVSLLFHMIVVLAGSALGRRLSGNPRLNLSWLGGLLLIVLAFLKIF